MNYTSIWLYRSIILLIPIVLVSCTNVSTSVIGVHENASVSGTEITVSRASQIQQQDTSKKQGETYGGIPVGFTVEGYPYIGSPDAPVTLVEFSDYLCPFCGRHFNQTTPALLDNYVESGLARLVFREFPIASLHPTAHFGSAAALCAGEQSAVQFWTMHDELFKRQDEWSRLSDPTEFLYNIAVDIELDLDLYTDCVETGEMQDVVEAGIAEAQDLGLTGTPSFQFVSSEAEESYTLVGAQPITVFSQWIDALLAGDEPPVEPEPEKPELPYWANEEGLQPDPDNPGHTLAGDQYKGDENAAIVVVEFSDFQCPACARHSNDVQPILDETFVEPGDVRWVFKHLPLQEHQFAPVSASAAECAAEQGAFWEMHDLLYESIENWAGPVAEVSILDSFETIFTNEDEDEADLSTEDGEEEVEPSRAIEDVEFALVELADSLELDTIRFESCLKSRQPLERVLHDVFDARGIVQQTPTFVILYDGQGAMLRGTKDADLFSSRLDNYVERAVKDSAFENKDD